MGPDIPEWLEKVLARPRGSEWPITPYLNPEAEFRALASGVAAGTLDGLARECEARAKPILDALVYGQREDVVVVTSQVRAYRTIRDRCWELAAALRAGRAAS
jgi:hypothetical protein